MNAQTSPGRGGAHAGSPVTWQMPTDGVALVTMDRRHAANAVDGAMTRGFQRAVAETEADEQVRVVVLCSAHSRVFCAGADLLALANGDIAELFPAEGGFAGFVRAVRAKPWIAVVDGAALAGGLELALACDMVLCSPEARFALPEVSRGLAALAGGLQRLPGRIPAAVAMDMVLTGDPIDGARAWQLGLVSRMAPSDQLMELALATARTIASHAPGAVRDSLSTARLTLEVGEERAWQETAQVEQRRLASDEVAEGVRAFIEKRLPSWR